MNNKHTCEQCNPRNLHVTCDFGKEGISQKLIVLVVATRNTNLELKKFVLIQVLLLGVQLPYHHIYTVHVILI